MKFFTFALFVVTFVSLLVVMANTGNQLWSLLAPDEAPSKAYWVGSGLVSFTGLVILFGVAILSLELADGWKATAKKNAGEPIDIADVPERTYIEIHHSCLGPESLGYCQIHLVSWKDDAKKQRLKAVKMKGVIPDSVGFYILPYLDAGYENESGMATLLLARKEGERESPSESISIKV